MGVAHVVPAGRVLAGFAPITAANRRVLVQEWPAGVAGRAGRTHRRRRRTVIWFKACPVLLTASAVLLATASIS
jgi:hypothetical protein